MILTALLWGAGILAGVGIVAAFWNDIVKFLKKAVEKVRRLVEGVVYGCKVFVKKMREAVKEISRHYSKVDQHWEETTVTKVISESEVPRRYWSGPEPTRSWILQTSWRCSWRAHNREGFLQCCRKKIKAIR